MMFQIYGKSVHVGVVHGSLKTNKPDVNGKRIIEPAKADVHRNTEVVFMTDVLALLVSCPNAIHGINPFKTCADHRNKLTMAVLDELHVFSNGVEMVSGIKCVQFTVNFRRTSHCS